MSIHNSIPLINTAKWDESTLQNIVVSFTMLEKAATAVFDKVDDAINESLSKIHEIENRVNAVHQSIKDLEKPGNKTIFYSAAKFPSFSSSNVQLSLPPTPSKEELESSLHSSTSFSSTQASSHAQTSKDGHSAMNAFSSLFTSKTPETPYNTPYLQSSQVGVIANLVCNMDPLSAYLESLQTMAYTPEDYFYSKHEVDSRMTSPAPSAYGGISDEEDEEVSLSGSIYKERRETRRVSGRVSLMIEPEDRRYSILHQKPEVAPPPPPAFATMTKKSMPPPRVPPPSISARLPLKAAPPPPPPPSTKISRQPPQVPQTQQMQQTSPTQSTVQMRQPSQPPSQPLPATAHVSPQESSSVTPRPVNPLMSALCAEIRATGGKVSTVNKTESQTEEASPAAVTPAPVVRAPKGNSSLLAEIQGADVKSILRQKREQLSASVSHVEKEEKQVVEPAPKQTAPELDLLQRRKLLFIESSSSDSSDWDMSDYRVC